MRNNGQLPVIVGVGGSGTVAVIELARAAQETGADALLLAPPPYNKPTQAGLIAHYRAVLEAVDLPMIPYNVPGRTACNLLPETITRIAEEARVVGVKEATGDLSQIADLAERLGDRLAIYSGNDDQIVPVLSLGGRGVISVLANVAPAACSQNGAQLPGGKHRTSSHTAASLSPPDPGTVPGVESDPGENRCRAVRVRGGRRSASPAPRVGRNPR